MRKMESALDAFQGRVASHLTGGQPRRGRYERWFYPSPPPSLLPPGMGRTTAHPSHCEVASLLGALQPCPERHPGMTPSSASGPMFPPQRGGSAVSSQYKNSMTLSGPPPPFPAPAPTVPSSPTPFEPVDYSKSP